MIRTVCLLALFVITAAAWAMEIDSRHDNNVDFSRYQTFSWEPQPERPAGHPLAPSSPLGGRIVSAVEKELAAKGLRKAGVGETADLRVAYNGFLEDLLDAASVHVEIAGDVSWVDTAGITPRSASKGTLIVRFLGWRQWRADLGRLGNCGGADSREADRQSGDGGEEDPRALSTIKARRGSTGSSLRGGRSPAAT